MLKINDKVFYIGYLYKTKNLKVIEIINDILVKVSGVFIYLDKNSQPYEKEEECVFRRFELTKKDPTNGKRIHTKNKWNNLITIIPNMGGVVKEVYEDVLKGKINLNPFYQRGLVWTLDQKQKYILALFQEKARINITTIVDIHSKSDCYIEVLDGKQRLTTIFDFIENKFKLKDGCYFKDLHFDDMKYLLNLTFHYSRIEVNHKHTCFTDEQKIELFLEINEMGTKMSKTHIAKVKKYIESEEKDEKN